jgi:hypothetical protein
MIRSPVIRQIIGGTFALILAAPAAFALMGGLLLR